MLAGDTSARNPDLAAVQFPNQPQAFERQIAVDGADVSRSRRTVRARERAVGRIDPDFGPRQRLEASQRADHEARRHLLARRDDAACGARLEEALAPEARGAILDHAAQDVAQRVGPHRTPVKATKRLPPLT